MHPSRSIGNGAYVFYGLLLLGLVGLIVAAPIAQPEDYHLFADTRSAFGIPNAWNVLSNVPFLFVAWLGLYECNRLDADHYVNDWKLVFWAIACVAFGSAFYHWRPDDSSLVFDRLPIAVGFTAFLAALIRERIDGRIGKAALGPLTVFGAASVAWWSFSGDLSLYVWAQAAPLVAIPLVATLFRASDDRFHLSAFAFYMLAKLAEMSDGRVLELTAGWISGHTLKHLLAAAGVGCFAWMLRGRAAGRLALRLS
jgi:hypothetical protein